MLPLSDVQVCELGELAVGSGVTQGVDGTERRAHVHTQGGDIEVEWRESDNEVVMTGRADVVYSGEWLEK